MQKFTYQTCIRLPQILKDEMSTICEQHQINESDLMRRAISEFVQTHSPNTDNNGKLMFV
jgi:predicted transcriptional regulator